jgi:hypothetical protein
LEAASFVSGALTQLKSLIPESAATQALRTKVQGSTICIQPIYLGDPDAPNITLPNGCWFGLRVLTTRETLDNYASHPSHDVVYRMHLDSKEEQDRLTEMLKLKDDGDASRPSGSEMQEICYDIVKGTIAKEWNRFRDVSVITAQEADVLLTFEDPKWRLMKEPGCYYIWTYSMKHCWDDQEQLRTINTTSHLKVEWPPDII